MTCTNSHTPAIDRALTILQLLGQYPQGISMHDMSLHSIAPRATLYRIVKTLMQREFVMQHSNDQSKFCLGPALTILGRKSPQQFDLLTLAATPMQLLSNQIGETVKLITRKNLEAVTLRVSDTGLDGRVISKEGTRMPLHIAGISTLAVSALPCGCSTSSANKTFTAQNFTDHYSARQIESQFEKVENERYSTRAW